MKNFLLLSTVLFLSGAAFAKNPQVEISAQSDFISGCGSTREDLTKDPDYQDDVNTALERLQKSAEDRCLSPAKAVTPVRLEGTCEPNNYFRGFGNITATATFECLRGD
jgi:hypothetical protein